MASPDARAGTESIEDLLDQQTRLQAWLTRLDKVGDDVPAHVSDRVRQDYQRRLDEVLASLAEHRDSLSSDCERLRERVEETQSAHRAAVDALEEGRLRHLIGEIDESEWVEQEQALEGAVESALEEHEGARAQLSQLEEIIGQVELPAPPAAPEAPPRPAPAPPRTPAPQATRPVAPPPAGLAPRPAPRPAAKPEPKPEPEPELDVMEEWEPDLLTTDDLLPAIQSAAPEALPEPEPPEEPELPELSEVPTLELEPALPAPRPEPEPEPEDDDILGMDAELPILGADSLLPAEEEDSSQDLAFLEELDRAIAATGQRDDEAPGSEEEPTADTRPRAGVKCPECGYSNDAGAWFCGVCGVDLA